MNSQKVSPKSRSSSFWTVASSFSFRHPISPWGDFQLTPQGTKPLDETFLKLKDATEILQYLTPLPSHRAHDPPPWGQQAFKDCTYRTALKGQRQRQKWIRRTWTKGTATRWLAVSHMTMTSGPFVLPTSQASASSKGPRESGALVDITSATRKVAIRQSRITFATTQTEGAWKTFHKCKTQMFHYLWKFLRGEGPYRLRRQVFQF